MPDIQIQNEKQLLKALQDAPFKAVVRKDKYTPVIKKIVVKNVYDEVYEKYKPSLYMRRYDTSLGGRAGLGSESNVRVEYDEKASKIVVSNTTRGREYDGVSKIYGDTDYYITPIIETGLGYSWKKSWIYKEKLARPFMKTSMQDIQQYFPTLMKQRDFRNTDNPLIKETPF